MRRTRMAIAELPEEPSGDPISAIWKMKAAFEKDVKQLVDGRPEQGAAGLIQTFRRLKEEFREDVFRQAPEFKPFERPPVKHRPGQPEAPSLAVPKGDSDTKKDGKTLQEEELEPSGEKDPSSFVYLDEVLETARQ
jgi:hypothetical protein